MHHHHHHFKSNQHNNQPKKPDYPSKPAPETMKKSSFLSKIRDRVREPPATKEEVEQLGLNAKRETFKTQIAKAKQARPSKLGGLLYGSSAPSGSRPRSYGKLPRQEESSSWLFGNNNSGSGFFDSGSSGKGLDEMIGMGGGSRKGKKNQRSGFDEMFS